MSSSGPEPDAGAELRRWAQAHLGQIRRPPARSATAPAPVDESSPTRLPAGPPPALDRVTGRVLAELATDRLEIGHVWRTDWHGLDDGRLFLATAASDASRVQGTASIWELDPVTGGSRRHTFINQQTPMSAFLEDRDYEWRRP